MERLVRVMREALSSEGKDFTGMRLNRAIVILAIPMVLEMVMEALFAIVDIYFVSKVSVEAVDAVGLTEGVITIVYSAAMGLAMAATAMVARRIGEKQPDEAARAAAQGVWLAVVVGILLGVLGFIFAPDILRLMGAGSKVQAVGALYARIMFGSNAVIIFLFLFNGIFRGAGDAVIAMRALWIANGVNILLDPLLIFGWGPVPALGVTGAAIATVAGRSVGVAYQVYHLFKSEVGGIQLRARHFSIDWGIVRRLGGIGAAGAGQYVIPSVSWIFLMRIIAFAGEDALAGYIIAIRVIIFTILPSWGLANAAATLVGQNLGAGYPERAAQSAWRAGFINMLFLLFVSVIFFIFSRPVIGIFHASPAVIEAGVLSLRIICVGYIFFAYGMVISQAFNGAGDTRTPTVINIFCFWLLEIPLGYFLGIGQGLGLAGVCWAVAISETVLAIVVMAIFKKGKWKETVI
ncbi:MAG: MATE family efflux transporter [Saprospiraceae bacterium]|jgi:putative MATE family efflux protein